ncbi:hypothetical protein [Campylobacter hyointestinalis]|uniref:hypothetical protein n=1 Tax=Campylobacter hyointestinalis TaxID=198 RepID=UPI000CE2C62A|nr:hypothetical protein [Campylobacter hyointestinalis]
MLDTYIVISGNQYFIAIIEVTTSSNNSKITPNKTSDSLDIDFIFVNSKIKGNNSITNTPKNK